MTSSTTIVVDDPERSEYELRVDGVPAGHVVYRRSGGKITLLHTEIGDEFGGRGLGGVLARGVLDDARTHGLAVRPDCPFIRGWIGKHPEYADLVAEHDRARYGL